MAKVRVAAPGLWGGISQQTQNLRHTNQVSTADNTRFDVTVGAMKRQPIKFVKTLTQLTTGINYRLHIIDRDDTEKYLVVYGESEPDQFNITVGSWVAGTKTFYVATGTPFADYTPARGDRIRISGGTSATIGTYRIATRVSSAAVTLETSISAEDLTNNNITTAAIPGLIKVFDTAGIEQSVIIDDDAGLYLEIGADGQLNGVNADDLIMTTVADHTIISNKTVSMRTKQAVSFEITKVYDNFEAMVADQLTVDEEHVAGQFFETQNATLGRAPGFWKFTGVHSGTSSAATYRTWTLTSDWLKPSTYKTDGRNDWGFRINFIQADRFRINGATWVNSSNSLIQEGAFADYTFTALDKITIISGTGVTPDVYTVASNPNDDTITLTESISTALTDLNEKKDITSGPNDNFSNVSGDMSAVTLNDLSDVASRFSDKLHIAQAGASCNFDSSNNKFVIVSPFKGEGAKIDGPFLSTASPSPTYDYAFTNPTYGKRPFVPTSDFERIEGTGNVNTDKAGTETAYTRFPSPGQLNATPDPLSMPIKMARIQPAFTTEEGVAVPAEFKVSLIKWNGRQTGDNDSNPAPTIFSGATSKLSDTAFFRNRLVLAADENLVFSQAGDFFNFYLNDAENIVDSDPIDIALSTKAVTIIDTLIPFHQTMVIFTKAGRQFEINTPQTFTPTSAAVNPTTVYPSINGIPPALSSFLMYFPAKRKESLQVFEYYFAESENSNTAADVTAHVFNLIPTDIKTLTTSSNNNAMFLIMRTGQKIYCYQSFFNGNTKVQSAWSNLKIESVDRIVDAQVLDNDLWIINELESGYALQSMAIPRDVPDIRSATWHSADLVAPVIGNYTSIDDGEFSVSIDGTSYDITDLDFTSDATFANIAATIQTKLQASLAGTLCIFSNNRFIITSPTSSINSELSTVTEVTGGDGTDISTLALIGGEGIAYPPTMPFIVHLDNLIEVQGVYSSSTGETTFTYTLDDPTIDQVVLGRSFGSRTGEWFKGSGIITRVSNTAIKMTGDFTAGKVYVGRDYGMDIELSQPFVRDSREESIIEGRFQMKRIYVEHQDTGRYDVKFTPPSGPTRTNVFIKNQVGVDKVGVVGIEPLGSSSHIVLGNSKTMKIQLLNDTPYPSLFSTVEFIGDFVRRIRGELKTSRKV